MPNKLHDLVRQKIEDIRKETKGNYTVKQIQKAIMQMSMDLAGNGNGSITGYKEIKPDKPVQ